MWVLWLAATLACGTSDDSHGGTAVGNPGNLTSTLADLDPDLGLSGATLQVEQVVIGDCDGDTGSLGPGDLDVLAQESWSLPVHAACSAELAFATPSLTLVGETTGDQPYSLRLDFAAQHWEGSKAPGEDLDLQISLAVVSARDIEDAALEPGQQFDVPPDEGLGKLWSDQVVLSLH